MASPILKPLREEEQPGAPRWHGGMRAFAARVWRRGPQPGPSPRSVTLQGRAPPVCASLSASAALAFCCAAAAYVASSPMLPGAATAAASSTAAAADARAPQRAAEAMTLRAARLRTALATIDGLQVELDWPADAPEGRLHLQAARLDAPSFGYAFRAMDWQCALARDGAGGWRCEGPLRGAGLAPSRLSVALGTGFTEVDLRSGQSRIGLERLAATPDDTRIDLAQVPVAWTQALLAQAWADGRLGQGTLDGHLDIRAPADGPLQVRGPLQVSGLSLETPDASIAAAGLGARLAVDYRDEGGQRLVTIDGTLQGGELLAGSAYVALPASPVGLRIEAANDGAAWRLPRLVWTDGDSLQAEGSAALAADGSLRALDLTLDSDDLAALPQRYLSGWLGGYGLADLALRGQLDARIRLDAEGLRGLDAALQAVDVVDGRRRFGFDGLDGTVRYSGDAQVQSDLRWRGGRLHTLEFGEAVLPMRSAGGEIALRAPVRFPAVGGHLRFDRFTLRPPQGGQGLQSRFALGVEQLRLGQVSEAFGWPAFRGTVSGEIPDGRFADDRLVFEGGLKMQVFDGEVRLSSLAMERPFGVAPTLSADVELDDLDLLAVTEVFDFGSISGRLDGEIRALRLVDWTATAFDARLWTERRRGVKQRISQRAVQNISSVGDSSFVTSLQGRLIAFFDDFGYRRIGIACRLRNEVCTMAGLDGVAPRRRDADGDAGLRSADGVFTGAAADASSEEAAAAGSGPFTIVAGSGIPRLDVVGHNRRVDWPTLLERVAAIGSGESSPVVE